MRHNVQNREVQNKQYKVVVWDDSYKKLTPDCVQIRSTTSHCTNFSSTSRSNLRHEQPSLETPWNALETKASPFRFYGSSLQLGPCSSLKRERDLETVGSRARSIEISSGARTSDDGKRKSYQRFGHPYRNYDQDERSAFARVNIKRTGLVGETVSVYQRLRLPSTTSPMVSLASTLGERGSNRGEGTRGYSLHWLLPASSGYCRTLPAMEQMGRLSSRLRSRFVTRGRDPRLADFFRFPIPRNIGRGGGTSHSDTVQVQRLNAR